MFVLSIAAVVTILSSRSLITSASVVIESSKNEDSEIFPVHFHTLKLYIKENTLILSIGNQMGHHIQSGKLGINIIPDEPPEITLNKTSDCLLLKWPLFGRLSIKHINHGSGLEYNFDWKLKTFYFGPDILIDKFLMDGSHWYGAAQVLEQEWPIEKWVKPEMAYVASDSYKDFYGGVQERYWFSSSGFAIYVEQEVPLFVSMNSDDDKTLTLISKWESPYNNLDYERAWMKYQVFISTDVKTVHELATGQVFQRPTGIPDEKMFKYPIWSTWARYKRNINKDTLISFAKEIQTHQFKASQIEIDDGWSTNYGDMEFDTKKFPDPAAMIEELKDLGFRVTLWVHPFTSLFSEVSSKPYWVRSGFFPGIMLWWNGLGQILDVTKTSAVDWYKTKLNNLKNNYKLTSFKFDGGEVYYLPFFSSPHIPWKNPNVYTTKYAEVCYSIDNETRALEVRVGVQTQHLPTFVRMMDKQSKWGYDNGLRSLIPHALTFGVLGYPFILPDMIGGNAYSENGMIGSTAYLPEKELYIRWLQVTVFMPSLQFSLSPWQYDNETLVICQTFTNLHEEYSNYMINLAKESVKSGAPIVRPLWWVAPNDTNAQTIDSEFLLGNNILVAPVLERGARRRNIYLPSGMWYDKLRNRILQGGRWYMNYYVELSELPYFWRSGIPDPTKATVKD